MSKGQVKSELFCSRLYILPMTELIFHSMFFISMRAFESVGMIRSLCFAR